MAQLHANSIALRGGITYNSDGKKFKPEQVLLGRAKKGPILQTVQKVSEEGFGPNKIKQSVKLKLDKSEHNLNIKKTLVLCLLVNHIFWSLFELN